MVAFSAVTSLALVGTTQAADAKGTSAKEVECLATAIYFEARGESELGQEAVAQVVLNRVADPRYPDTICGVVYQNESRRNACQFSFACDGRPETPSDTAAWQKAMSIAKRATSTPVLVAQLEDATNYHARSVNPVWAPKMLKVSTIGQHVFYKD